MEQKLKLGNHKENGDFIVVFILEQTFDKLRSSDTTRLQYKLIILTCMLIRINLKNIRI